MSGATQSAFLKQGRSKLTEQGNAIRLLHLKPEDRLVTGNAPLKNARFTWVTEPVAADRPDSAERWIVAGCGNRTVLWNFRRCAACCLTSQACTQYKLVQAGRQQAHDVDSFHPLLNLTKVQPLAVAQA